jgi:hypothetical protein
MPLAGYWRNKKDRLKGKKEEKEKEREQKEEERQEEVEAKEEAKKEELKVKEEEVEEEEMEECEVKEETDETEEGEVKEEEEEETDESEREKKGETNEKLTPSPKGPVTDYGATFVHWMRHRRPRYKGSFAGETERPSNSYIVDVSPSSFPLGTATNSVPDAASPCEDHKPSRLGALAPPALIS